MTMKRMIVALSLIIGIFSVQESFAQVRVGVNIGVGVPVRRVVYAPRHRYRPVYYYAPVVPVRYVAPRPRVIVVNRPGRVYGYRRF
jgi:hypothetical protein